MDQNSINVMRRALDLGVVSKRLLPIEKMVLRSSSLLSPLMAQLKGQRERYTIDPSWIRRQTTWQRPDTRRYQNSLMPPNSPLSLGVALPWMVEVSRWSVPVGYFGIVKSVEQFLSSPGLQTTVVHSDSSHWGNPFSWLPNRVKWYFRLSPLSGGVGPWINVTGISALADNLPGLIYTDMSVTDDLWYPAGSSSSANIHLPVPGGYCLRSYAIVPPVVGTSVALKMSGTIQSEVNSDTQTVARVVW